MKNNFANISAYTTGLPEAGRTESSPRKELKEWQTKERETLKQILGLEKFRKAPPTPRILSMKSWEDHILYDITMESEPGVVMPFFLLTPADAEILSAPEEKKTKDSSRKFLSDYPVVIVPHGHGCDGRYGPAGICRHKGLKANKRRFNHDIGIQFVRRGYIVLCPDARGAGDRRNPGDQGMELENLLTSSCTDLNNAFIAMGTCLAAAWCWDLMALTDMLMAKGWGDPERIGVCGFSGGGLQALIYSALDRRIRCTGVSGYFFKFEDCLLDSNMCSCNFIPSFPLHFDMASLGALIAPGSLIIEKALSDPLNGRRGIRGPRELIEDVKRSYRMAESEDHFVYSEVVGEHHFSGRDIFSFFDSHMKI